MNTVKQANSIRQLFTHIALVAICLVAAFAVLAPLYADEPVTMAPPVAGSDQASGSGGDGAASSVFNWTDVPQNQQVPIQRATFDEGGYQLYDTSGEMIVVPFQNDNLYVMKFAISDDGSTYFINDGNAPILYMPEDGYLENAAVAGARWYPFSPSWRPSSPVFIGPAPSWTLFIGLGWYPGMYYHGGYWGIHPFWAGGLFVATPGLVFIVGGHNYYGWGAYHSYYVGHPGWHPIMVVRRNFYTWAAHPAPGRPGFGGFGAGPHPQGGGGFHSVGGGSTGFHGVGGGSTGFHGVGGGSTGFHGAGGSTGFHGAGGSTGFHGASGSTGFHGASGSTGFHGASGGSTGFHGAGGSTGFHGASGSPGGMSNSHSSPQSGSNSHPSPPSSHGSSNSNNGSNSQKHQ